MQITLSFGEDFSIDASDIICVAAFDHVGNLVATVLFDCSDEHLGKAHTVTCANHADLSYLQQSAIIYKASLLLDSCYDEVDRSDEESEALIRIEV